MLIENIKDLQFKKDEVFKNEYFWIRYDNIYLTDEFAKLYIKEYKQKVDRIIFTPTTINMSVKLNFINVKLSIYFREIHFDNNDEKKKYKWLVCGSSGSHGFNGLEYTKKETFGVRTRRKVIKHMVNLFLENKKLNRIEKIKNILYN
jgi:hypothetical protein